MKLPSDRVVEYSWWKPPDVWGSGRHFGKKVFEKLTKDKCCRNVTCNLAWTDPTANTVMQEDISLAMVENFVLDDFLDSSMHAMADSAVAEDAYGAASAPELAENQPRPYDLAGSS